MGLSEVQEQMREMGLPLIQTYAGGGEVLLSKVIG